jgi:dihydrofolate reductase
VITRDRQWSHEGVLTCHELNEALERAFEQALIDGADAVMVVGGAEIYRLALSRADKVILTRVHDEVIGDVRFDLEVFADWRQVSSSRYEAVEGNSHAFSIEELEAP